METSTKTRGMTGRSQMAAGPGTFESLERAGECKNRMDLRMKHGKRQF